MHFLGFKPGIKGYVMFDLLTHVTFISRNVIFHESEFPYAMITPSPTHTNNTDIADQGNSDFIFDYPLPHSVLPPAPATHAADTPPCLGQTDDSEAPALRRSERVRKTPTYLQEYHCNSMCSHKTDSVRYPLSDVLSYANISPHHLPFISSITVNEEPKNYKQAIQHKHWIEAMNYELEALHQNGNWSITDLPPGNAPIGCKWVFKIKYKYDGSIERYKARLVAKGYTQIEGMDFLETFSPIAKATTIRLLLAMAST